jgi:hypothetical protein
MNKEFFGRWDEGFWSRRFRNKMEGGKARFVNSEMPNLDSPLFIAGLQVAYLWYNHFYLLEPSSRLTLSHNKSSYIYIYI